MLAGLLAMPQAFAADGTDDRINSMFAPVADAVSAFVFYPIPLGGEATMPAMVLWLIIAATFFTIYFRFINVSGFKQGGFYHAIKQEQQFLLIAELA